jgi:hypothetical protein
MKYEFILSSSFMKEVKNVINVNLNNWFSNLVLVTDKNIDIIKIFIGRV